MNEGPHEVIQPGRRIIFGLKTLMAFVACCGLVFWASRAVREGLIPAHGWARSLRSGDVEARQVAASQLFQVKEAADVEVAIPALIEALDDESEEVASTAASSLGMAGSVAIKLRVSGPEVRASAKALARKLEHKSVRFRVAAASALQTFAAASAAIGESPMDLDSAAASLARSLDDPSDQARDAAARALGQVAQGGLIGPPPSLLAAASGAGSGDTRALAATALGSFRSGSDVAIAALEAALVDREPKVRQAAASSLGKFGPKARPSLPALVCLLREPYVPPPVVPPADKLKTTFGSPAPPPFPAAGAALAIGSIVSGESVDLEALRALEGVLRDGESSRRPAAAQAFFLMGQAAPPSIPTLMTTLIEGASLDVGYESWAARALGQVAPGGASAGEVIEALTKGLEARSSGTRGYSAQALGRFGPAASAALPRLWELREGKDPFVAGMARAAIARIEKK